MKKLLVIKFLITILALKNIFKKCTDSYIGETARRRVIRTVEHGGERQRILNIQTFQPDETSESQR